MPLLPATDDDLPFLREMLVEAAFPPGTERPSDPLADGHVTRYLDGWGRDGDAGLVAVVDGRPVGAAWTRLLPPERPGYGHVDGETPELTLAVAEPARGRGLGRALAAGALDLAAAHGHRRVSLSVALANEPAVGLYRSLGFTDVAPDGTSMTMVASTAPAPPPPEPPAGPTPGPRLATVEDGPALARLRREMIAGMDVADEGEWVQPFVAMWPGERAAERWAGALVPGSDGRAVASALAVTYPSPPGPGRPDGRVAHVGSVATEPAWRRRGAARAAVSLLLAHLDEAGVQTSTLNASADGSALYLSLGYRPAIGRAMRRPRP